MRIFLQVPNLVWSEVLFSENLWFGVPLEPSHSRKHIQPSRHVYLYPFSLEGLFGLALISRTPLLLTPALKGSESRQACGVSVRAPSFAGKALPWGGGPGSTNGLWCWYHLLRLLSPSAARVSNPLARVGKSNSTARRVQSAGQRASYWWTIGPMSLETSAEFLPNSSCLPPLLNKARVSHIKSLPLFSSLQWALTHPNCISFSHSESEKETLFSGRNFFPQMTKRSPQIICNTLTLDSRCLLWDTRNPDWNLKAITAGRPRMGSVIGSKVEIATQSRNRGLRKVTWSACSIHSESSSLSLLGLSAPPQQT